MSRTKTFFDTVMGFRENLRRISKDYGAELERIEYYKGSEAYDDALKSLKAKRKDEIELAQQQARDAFSSVLSGMKEAATSRPMVAPSSEVLAILQTLKMRSTISADELRQAALTVGDCPLALSVLDELARDHGHMGLHFGKESTDSILQHIDSLARNAAKITRMEGVDRKREAVEASRPYSPNYSPSALELYSVDRDFSSEQEALAWLGDVVDYDSFSKAVN